MLLIGDLVPNDHCVRADACADSTVLCNLEAPLIPLERRTAPIAKAGPVLSGMCIPYFRNCQAVCTLANNHIMDYGSHGLNHTIDALEAKQMRYLGAGASLDDARRPFVASIDGVTTGIIACCETQFGSAGTTTPGVAPMGLWVRACIKELARSCRIVVVTVHAGYETSPWPSPALQDLYRSWIDDGATIVHGHHPHVPQGFEQYQHGLILYGLGNFLIDPERWAHIRDATWSVGARITRLVPQLEWRPITFSCGAVGDEIHVAEESLKPGGYRAEYLDAANGPLHERPLLESLWHEISVRSYYAFYGSWLGVEASRIGAIKSVARKLLTALRGQFESLDDQLMRYHLFACQTHRDAIETALGVVSGSIEDLRTATSAELVDRMMPWLPASRGGARR